MAWTSPRTWVALETVTASQLNTHLRDNMLETAPAKVTTAGDIVYATGANAIARLAIGSKFKTLQVNAGATAPQWGAAVQHVMKTANESVTSSTSLQNDNELLFPVGANETWLFEVMLYIAAVSGTNFDFDFSVPAGASGHYSVMTGQSPSVIIGASITAETTLETASGTAKLYHLTGVAVIGGTSGNVQLRWAQNSSSVNALTLQAGSMLRATRVV